MENKIKYMKSNYYKDKKKRKYYISNPLNDIIIFIQHTEQIFFIDKMDFACFTSKSYNTLNPEQQNPDDPFVNNQINLITEFYLKDLTEILISKEEYKERLKKREKSLSDDDIDEIIELSIMEIRLIDLRYDVKEKLMDVRYQLSKHNIQPSTLSAPIHEEW